MGSTESHFVVYSRNRTTDKYDEDPVVDAPEMTDMDGMGVFKREAHTFALQKTGDFRNTKAIYLYRNGWRIVRAEFVPVTMELQLTFRNAAYRAMWLESTEKLGDRRWPLYERQFEACFKTHNWQDTGDITYIRNK
jgi:hypothetical protein